jgi:soluble lytic murein transglycosylase
VLVSGAYNAGPHSVDRWMDRRQSDDPVIWVETLPYYETRDYIPRVLAFTTLYDWRLQQPVQRLSSRMPSLAPSGQGAMISGETVEVVCPSTATTAGS